MSWETKTKKECTAYKDLDEPGVGGNIIFTDELYKVIKTMLKKHAGKEWQMLLKGAYNDDGGLVLDGYYIPKQEVTGSTVKNLDVLTPESAKEARIVATIHSHASMGVFFSHVDIKDTCMSFLKHHIVVNERLEWCAGTQWKLPNGTYTVFPAKVYIESVEEDVTIEGMDNITETAPLVGYQKDWSTPAGKNGKNNGKVSGSRGYYYEDEVPAFQSGDKVKHAKTQNVGEVVHVFSTGIAPYRVKFYSNHVEGEYYFSNCAEDDLAWHWEPEGV
jgi:hypothetical protein